MRERVKRKKGVSAVPWTSYLDQRPIIVALAGPNGAGKSTFYEAFLKRSGLRFINADRLARELGIGAYPAAEMAAALRRELVRQRESFVFETVFSDPVGDKLAFLKEATANGYAVVLCFIGLPGANVSEKRVAMRVLQGGHDVPTEKLVARFPRILKNFQAAVQDLPCVVAFDHGDLRTPFRHVATLRNGQRIEVHPPTPAWLPN